MTEKAPLTRLPVKTPAKPQIAGLLALAGFTDFDASEPGDASPELIQKAYRHKLCGQ